MRRHNKIVIIGMGLIGGSLALQFMKRNMANEVVGFDKNTQSLKTGVELNIINRYEEDITRAVTYADLIILATPVGQFIEIATKITPFLKQGAIVTDVGSTKGNMVEKLEEIISQRARFVGGHPIAGKEKSGVDSADFNLFNGARSILTPTGKTDQDALSVVKDLWEQIGSKVILMDPFIHDQIMALVSHLPHIIAYTLVNTVLDCKIGEYDPVSLSAGGFRDFTRIAGSSSEMWRDIFLMNDKNLIEMIERYQSTLEKLKGFIKMGDTNSLILELEKAKGIRKRLEA